MSSYEFRPKGVFLTVLLIADVDEKGTEAAAASAAITESRTVTRFRSDFPLIDFVADHPFLFAIRHNPTKLIIFVGRAEKFRSFFTGKMFSNIPSARKHERVTDLCFHEPIKCIRVVVRSNSDEDSTKVNPADFTANDSLVRRKFCKAVLDGFALTDLAARALLTFFHRNYENRTLRTSTNCNFSVQCLHQI